MDKSHLYPIFGVRQNHAADFSPLAHRLDHQLSQQKLVMGRWEMNNSLRLHQPGFLLQAHVLLPTLAPGQQLGEKPLSDDDREVAGCSSILFGLSYHFRSCM